MDDYVASDENLGGKRHTHASAYAARVDLGLLLVNGQPGPREAPQLIAQLLDGVACVQLTLLLLEELQADRGQVCGPPAGC